MSMTMRINVKSAGRRLDYEWDEPSVSRSTDVWTSVLHDMDELYSMVIRCEAEGCYGIFMGAMLPPEGVRDNHGRLIRVSYLVQGLSEQQARSLAVTYLQNRKAVERALCSTEVLTFADFFAVNKDKAFVAIEKLLREQDMPETSAETSPLFLAEKEPGLRVEEAVEFLKQHHLSRLPGYRVVCSELLHVEKLSGKEDMTLLWGDEARYDSLRNLSHPEPTDDESKLGDKHQALIIPLLILLFVSGILGILLCKCLYKQEILSVPTTKPTETPTPKPADIQTAPSDTTNGKEIMSEGSRSTEKNSDQPAPESSSQVITSDAHAADTPTKDASVQPSAETQPQVDAADAPMQPPVEQAPRANKESAPATEDSVKETPVQPPMQQSHQEENPDHPSLRMPSNLQS